MLQRREIFMAGKTATASLERQTIFFLGGASGMEGGTEGRVSEAPGCRISLLIASETQRKWHLSH